MSSLNGIKNIVFDLGVVLFDLDYGLTIAEFKNYEEIFSEDRQIKLFDNFERGEIQIPEFLDGLRAFIPAEVTDQSIIDAWNAMLLGFPQSNIQLLNMTLMLVHWQQISLLLLHF